MPEGQDEAASLRGTDVPVATSCDLRALSLGRVEAYILAQIDGTSSVEDLASLTSLSAPDICAVLTHLHDLGAIRLPRRGGVSLNAPRGEQTAIAPHEESSDTNARREEVSLDSVPRLTGSRTTTLDIEVREAFVLAQVDGTTSASEIAAITGLSLQELSLILRRLETAGALALHVSASTRSSSSTGRRHEAIAVDVFTTARSRRGQASRATSKGRAAPAPASSRGAPISSRAAPASSRGAPASSRGARALPAESQPPAPTVPRSQVPTRATVAQTPDETSADPTSQSVPDRAPPSAARNGRARIRISTGRIGAPLAPVQVSEKAAEATAQSATHRGPPRDADPPDQTLALARFFTEKADHENREHARVFTEAAEYELARGNVVAAAAQYQLALKACNAPEIRRAYESVLGQAQARRVEMHSASADTAEREGRWSDAAAAYARAYDARSDSRIADRLANAIRLSSGDLREAAKMGEEAVRQDGRNAGYRITLGEVYAAAGLELRAQGEAKRALELAPLDPRALALVAKLAKRGASQ